MIKNINILLVLISLSLVSCTGGKSKDDLKNSNVSLEFRLTDKIEKTKQELLDRIDAKYDKIFNLVDGLASEVRDSRDSRTIFSYRIEDLEKRTRVLEKSLVQ